MVFVVRRTHGVFKRAGIQTCRDRGRLGITEPAPHLEMSETGPTVLCLRGSVDLLPGKRVLVDWNG